MCRVEDNGQNRGENRIEENEMGLSQLRDLDEALGEEEEEEDEWDECLEGEGVHQGAARADLLQCEPCEDSGEEDGDSGDEQE